MLHFYIFLTVIPVRNMQIDSSLLCPHVSVRRSFPRADLYLGSSCENLTGSYLPTGDGG